MRNYIDEFLRFFNNLDWNNCFAVAKAHGEFKLWYARNKAGLDSLAAEDKADIEFCYTHNWQRCKNTKVVQERIAQIGTEPVIVAPDSDTDFNDSDTDFVDPQDLDQE